MRSTYVVNVIDILVGCSEEHDNVFQVDLFIMVLINLFKDLLQQDFSVHALWRIESFIFNANCHCHCVMVDTLYSFILSSAAMQGEGGMVPQR